jgi:hypothetical protein
MLRPAIVGALFRLFRYTVLFYLLTGILGVLTAALWYFTLFGGSKALFFPVPFFTAAAFLIYARLLGRLAWRVGRLKQPKQTKSKKRKPGKKETSPVRGVEVQDPWAAPKEEVAQNREEQESQAHQAPAPPPPLCAAEGKAGDSNEELPPGMSRSPYGGLIERTGGYDTDDSPESAPSPAPMPLDGWSPVGMAEPEEELGAGSLAEKADQAVSQLEKRLAQRPPKPWKPTWTFFSGTWSFPWYSETQRAWLWLSFGTLVLGGMVMMLVQFFPG